MAAERLRLPPPGSSPFEVYGGGCAALLVGLLVLQKGGGGMKGSRVLRRCRCGRDRKDWPLPGWCAARLLRVPPCLLIADCPLVRPPAPPPTLRLVLIGAGVRPHVKACVWERRWRCSGRDGAHILLVRAMGACGVGGWARLTRVG